MRRAREQRVACSASDAGIEQRVAGSVSEIAIADGQPVKRIQLLRIGANPTRDGRKVYQVENRAHAEEIVAATAKYHGSTDPMVDYDHQSVFGTKDGVGGKAPASGWMKSLTVEADGIYADVEWTKAAAAALVDHEYRYISPYFGHTASGRVTRIFNAALTNRPELELKAVASQTSGENMDEIIKALGLSPGASVEDVLQAIAAMTTTAASAKAALLERTAICSTLGVAETATLEEIRTAASAGGKVDPTKFVPIGELTELRTRMDTIDEERVTASVDAAITAGKIRPAAESRAWALDYARKDAVGFAKYVGMQPAIVVAGAEELRSAAMASDTLTDEEKAICAQTNVSEADYLASRKELAN